MIGTLRSQRLLVYVDQLFFREGDALTTNDCYWAFVRALASHFDSTTFLARVHPRPGRGPYACTPADGFEAIELPWVDDLKSIAGMLAVLPRTLRIAWTAVGNADVVRLEIPHPWAPAVGMFAVLRRKRLLLFDRQDGMARTRHRTKGWKRTVALGATAILQWADRQLARRALTFCGDSAIADRYRSRGIEAYVLLESVVTEEMLARSAPRRATPEGNPRLLWVGRLESDKGLDLLFAALAPSMPDRLTLDVAGGGSDATRLREQAATLGLGDRVRFHGYVPFGPQLESLYREASLYVHAGREAEGFPKTLLEAFACGLPVVAQRTTGIERELEDGREALLVDPHEPTALAAAIERLLDDPALYRRLSAGGLAFVRERTLEKQARRVAEILRAGPGPRRLPPGGRCP